ncbi:MAG: hypothetical protein WBL61_17870, partial [Bryobacteraceae bacterium]
MAKITPVLSCSSIAWLAVAGPAATAPGRPKATSGTAPTLAALARAYRTGPTPARRAAVENWAALHPQDAPLEQLALGVVAYEQKDYQTAAADLRKARPKLPRIADYVGYYLAAARVEAGDFADVARDLDPVHRPPSSPLAGRAWVLEARARQNADPAGAVKLLRDHYAELPEPEGGLTLADCYVAAGDPASAADFLERADAQFVTGEAASRAADALRSLQERMGDKFPQPLPQQLLHRADRLLEARKYAEARTEFEAAAEKLNASERDQALVRASAAEFLDGHAGAACEALNRMKLDAGEADAERFYYVAECAHQAGDEAPAIAALDRLNGQYPKSPWRLKALLAAAGRSWVRNQPQTYLPLYQAAYENFPGDPQAAQWHWRVAFRAYFERRNDAEYLLREQLRNYPGAAQAAAALYFLGRLAEEQQDFGAARLYFERVVTAMEGYYFAGEARERLRRTEVRNAGGAPKAAAFLAGLT